MGLTWHSRVIKPAAMKPLNLSDLEQQAKESLPQIAYDYFASGAWDEVTLRENRAAFERNRQQFLARLEEAMGRWNKLLEPYKGAPVVVNHNMWVYFLARFGLVQAGSIEERPGIPPTPSHLVKLVNQMKQERIKVIVVEPWGDLKTVQRVAQEAGAQAAVLASSVGALKGTDTYINWVDSNVKMLAQALK